ncbi:hypothetical protein [Pseudomonas sp. BP8]|uniref:hypothetical protein n=1 Tax=Pseudomonas sp. BP8 TaxID=2817864 RepID=UPI001DB4EB5D|nr:hypothetical protein [Pseudomonas sp. BP8]MBP2264447.1 D-alanyl-lipoteichoic acid acyltransferase DltB (MBOAT superfamily) [Pseudomonas sp. BP8]
MSFLSIEFGLCFTLFFILYWSLCGSVRVQNALLLAASYALVASFSLQSLGILLGYSALVYLLGLLVGPPDSIKQRKARSAPTLNPCRALIHRLNAVDVGDSVLH